MTKLAGLTQGYDLAGNLTLAFSADRGTSYIYKYDHHNRLIEVRDSTETTRKAAFTYDALGRRIEHVNDVLGTTTRYYYDGVNEIVETDGSSNDLRYYVHGISYVDERLMMVNIDEYYNDQSEEYEDRPYYYALDRMYNVRFLIDWAGALVERYMYDAYGRPWIRKSARRGDMNNDTLLTSLDTSRFTAAKNGTLWDPRADMDDDGDIDSDDQTAYDIHVADWPPPTMGGLTVKQAFSGVGNPFGFQGRVHFTLDTADDATEAVLPLVDHRGRMNDPVTGRWLTRDPLPYNPTAIGVEPLSVELPDSPFATSASRNQPSLEETSLYLFLHSNPISGVDPSGLKLRFAKISHPAKNIGISLNDCGKFQVNYTTFFDVGTSAPCTGFVIVKVTVEAECNGCTATQPGPTSQPTPLVYYEAFPIQKGSSFPLIGGRIPVDTVNFGGKDKSRGKYIQSAEGRMFCRKDTRRPGKPSLKSQGWRMNQNWNLPACRGRTQSNGNILGTRKKPPWWNKWQGVGGNANRTFGVSWDCCPGCAANKRQSQVIRDKDDLPGGGLDGTRLPL